MQDNDPNRIAHLGMIEEVVKRQASNSFIVKGWSLTLVSALAALSITNKSVEIAFLIVIPAMVFWGLDVYWLRQEKLFRGLYNYVRTAEPGSLESKMFSMDTSIAPETVSVFRTIFNPTIVPLHGVILAATIVVIIFVITSKVPEV